MSSQQQRYLELWRVSKSYPAPGGGETVIVEDFNLTIAQGEFVTLIGHSGCGKSTVLSMVSGLTELSSGGIVLDHREIARPGTDRGIVFQSPCLLPWLTAVENVQLGVNEVFGSSKTKTERWKIAAHYLELVGLGSALHKRPGELSQGMRQRVGIARAFALHPKVLLLDEPFGMLDAITRMELQDILIDLWTKDSKTAVMVTHDVDEALLLSDRIVMMTNGPHARVGDILEVPFERPRNRHEVMEDPRYYALREQLISFLEAQDSHRHEPPSAPAEPPTVATVERELVPAA
jgi:nitrate/nitrite transport system ATP-binding protein